jgi:hypothetical protein
MKKPRTRAPLKPYPCTVCKARFERPAEADACGKREKLALLLHEVFCGCTPEKPMPGCGFCSVEKMPFKWTSTYRVPWVARAERVLAGYEGDGVTAQNIEDLIRAFGSFGRAWAALNAPALHAPIAVRRIAFLLAEAAGI